ncbi:RHO1 GDP-GTP exchange protein 2, partial [Serendipita sp. 399]
MASIVEDLTDLSGRIGQLTNLPVFDGTYSKVYRGEYANRTKILRERVIWGALNHPNILPLIGYAEGDERFEPFGALISPWCINGDAARFLEERGPSLSLEKRIMLWEGVVQGVDYLHNLNPVIVHGDLKPANVLLDGHENPRICDFGLARLILEEDGSGMTTTSAHTGTERYLAYELVASDDTSMPTMESDIHALGCMGLDFIFLQLPYSHRRNNARGHIFLDIRQGVPPAVHPGSIGALEESYWNIIASCWSMDPAQRPVTGALLADLHAAISPQIWTTSDDHLDTEVNDASNALFNASIIKQNSQPDKPSLSIPNSHLWIHNVPKEVADTLSSSEKERQEAINELIRTERDFVRDMEYLRDVWVSSIRNSDVIPAERREEFISHDFWKILAILDVNTRLRDALTKRQKEFVVVGQIGDIFQEIVPLFDPFVEYGTQQMYAKYKFEKEKARDPAFAALMD